MAFVPIGSKVLQSEPQRSLGTSVRDVEPLTLFIYVDAILLYSFRIWTSDKVNFNPHAPDRFTPSRARCAENCGSALTHR